MKKLIPAVMLSLTALAFTSCDKDEAPNNNKNNNYETCLGPKRIINDGPLTYTNLLDQKAPEFLDSLSKYNKLQAKSLKENGSDVILECNVWTNNGVQLFFAKYGLKKDLNTGVVSNVHNNVIDYDLGGLNLGAGVRYESAFDSAQQHFIYDQMCVLYTLGVYDQAPLLNVDTPVYKLAWKFEGKKTGNIVYINAKDGTVLDKTIIVTND